MGFAYLRASNGGDDDRRPLTVRRRPWSVFAIALLCTGAAVLTGTTLSAHEIGTSRVAVQFDNDRRFTIDVVTDAKALLAKLEASHGGTSAIPSDDTTLSRRLETLDDIFRGRVLVAFDECPVPTTVAFAVTPAADGSATPIATIRLTGQVPEGSRRFTWRYGWTFASYALAIRTPASPDATTEWLEGDTSSTPFPIARHSVRAGRTETAWRYLALGFTHIVPEGLDHILFVLGLFLLTGRARSILWQVSTFTVAHSITLGLAAGRLLSVPPRVIEPLIAATIVLAAADNLRPMLGRRRAAAAFFFGLVHGFGFAGPLLELELPPWPMAQALLQFNLGVEAGQLVVVALAIVLLAPLRARDAAAWLRGGSAAAGLVALVWLGERLLNVKLLPV